jgi:hypothetical protein
MYKGAIELLNGSPDPADINWYATEAEKHLGNLVSLAPILELHDVVMERLGLLAVEEQTLFARASASFSRVACSHRLERAGLRLDPPTKSLSVTRPRYSLPRPHPRFSHSSKSTFPFWTLPFILLYLLLAHSFTYFTCIPHSLPTTPTPCADNLRHLYA